MLSMTTLLGAKVAERCLGRKYPAKHVRRQRVGRAIGARPSNLSRTVLECLEPCGHPFVVLYPKYAVSFMTGCLLRYPA